MSYINVDFDESRRCADVIESLARQLRELAISDDCEPRELCHTLDVYCRKLFDLSADLTNATLDYQIADDKNYGRT